MIEWETPFCTFCIDVHVLRNTVYIGFCDQPQSQGSRSLNPMEVAKLSGFSLGLATRWSLKAILAGFEAGPLGITTLTVAISLNKKPN